MKWTLVDESAPPPPSGGKWVMVDEPAAPHMSSAPRGTISEIGRQVGLTARAGLKGLAQLPGMVIDPAMDLFHNNRARMLNAGAGREVMPLIPRTTDAVDQALTGMGLPAPENATERVAQDVAGAMAGGGVMSAGGRVLAGSQDAVARGLGNTLASGPGLNVVSSGTSAGAAGVTREEGGGAGAQFTAGVLGAVAPAAAVATGAGAVRGTFRGGEAGRRQMVERMDEFRAAGIDDPTVGQATGRRGTQATESMLSRTPGGAGRIIERAEQEAGQLGGRVSSVADDLAKGVDDTRAGMTIEKGIREFSARFKDNQRKLYDALDAHIPRTERVDITSTRNALDALNQKIPGAPETSRFFQNSRIMGIERAVKADTESAAGAMSQLPPIQQELMRQLPEVERNAVLNGMIDGRLPFEALKKLRTLVGNELSEHSIASDVPRSKWKALYAALSDDMRGAAQASGPEAERALKRANDYTSAGIGRIEAVLDRVVGQNKPAEKVYQAAVGEARNGATTINAVMRSLQEPEREVVRSAFIRRLGEATPGNQGADGGTFSARTFLTEWNKIDPAAKRVLFAGRDGAIVRDLDAVARAAEMIDKGSKVFNNPSGTSQAVTLQQSGFGALVAVLTGNVPVAAGIGGAIAGSHGMSRLMTNKDFVTWLAQSTRMPAGAIPAHLGSLDRLSKDWPEKDAAAAREFVSALGQTQSPQSTR